MRVHLSVVFSILFTMYFTVLIYTNNGLPFIITKSSLILQLGPQELAASDYLYVCIYYPRSICIMEWKRDQPFLRNGWVVTSGGVNFSLIKSVYAILVSNRDSRIILPSFHGFGYFESSLYVQISIETRSWTKVRSVRPLIPRINTTCTTVRAIHFHIL